MHAGFDFPAIRDPRLMSASRLKADIDSAGDLTAGCLFHPQERTCASAGHRRPFGAMWNCLHRHQAFRAINSIGAMWPLATFWIMFCILSGAFLPIKR
jgi:hypothetical protein